MNYSHPEKLIAIDEMSKACRYPMVNSMANDVKSYIPQLPWSDLWCSVSPQIRFVRRKSNSGSSFQMIAMRLNTHLTGCFPDPYKHNRTLPRFKSYLSHRSSLRLLTSSPYVHISSFSNSFHCFFEIVFCEEGKKLQMIKWF